MFCILESLRTNDELLVVIRRIHESEREEYKITCMSADKREKRDIPLVELGERS